MGDSVVHALDGVDLTINDGEFVAIIGASGSGKSTLMHLIGCLDRPTRGALEIDGHLVGAMTEKQLANIRNANPDMVTIQVTVNQPAWILSADIPAPKDITPPSGL